MEDSVRTLTTVLERMKSSGDIASDTAESFLDAAARSEISINVFSSTANVADMEHQVFAYIEAVNSKLSFIEEILNPKES